MERAARLVVLVRGQELPDGGQEGRRDGHHRLIPFVRGGHLVGRCPFLVRPSVQLGHQPLHPLFVPPGREPLSVHCPRLLRRRRYALSALPVNGYAVTTNTPSPTSSGT